MAKKRLTLIQLSRILRSFGVEENRSKGKGSHVTFWRTFPDGKRSYPVPNRKDVKPSYVKGCRRAFHLMEEDGVTDEDFYARA